VKSIILQNAVLAIFYSFLQDFTTLEDGKRTKIKLYIGSRDDIW